MKKITRHNIIIIFLVLFIGWGPLPVWAQTDGGQPTQAELEQQLQAIEQEIAQYQQQLSQVQGIKNVLINKINQLKSSQAKLKLQIKSTNLRIADLDRRISTTQVAIDKNQTKSDQLQEGVAELVHQLDRYDSQPFWQTFFNTWRLTDLFVELESYLETMTALDRMLLEARDIKTMLAQQQETFSQQQDEAKDLVSVKILQQQELISSVQEQSVLLTETKGRESNYQTILNDTKKRAAEIRNRIYDLFGVAKNITFEQALKIAQEVSRAVNIRPAFLLAVLTQESNLGRNVGTCNRPDDPPTKSWRVIMKPDRDQEPFMQITSELGRNPDSTPVSCPMRDRRGNRIGWGGAMGPAQFIPSTWMGYRDRVTQITGKTFADPWDIRDAFYASAIKLQAGGANGTRQGEWNAAMRYFSGSTNLRYRFYGDNVLATADKYQNDIDTLNK